jgi:hypothetical protein
MGQRSIWVGFDPRGGLVPIVSNSEISSLSRGANISLERLEPRFMPVSGYYEWQDTPEGKQPWYFTARDGSPVLTIAGLWDRIGSTHAEAGGTWEGVCCPIRGIAARSPRTATQPLRHDPTCHKDWTAWAERTRTRKR